MRINRDLELVLNMDFIILYLIIISIALLDISIVVAYYDLIGYSFLTFIIIDILLTT